MESRDKDYVGSDLKFLIDVTSTGFDKERDEFEVTVSRGQREKTFHKDELVVDEHGDYYLCFSTNDFGPGLYRLTVTTHVPDDDFDDGIRDEVTQLELVQVKMPKK